MAIVQFRTINWKKILRLAAYVTSGGFLAAVIIVVYFIFQVPDPSIFAVRRVNESTKIYDRTGKEILYDVHGEEKRTVIAWDAIPQVVKDATLASEDSDFYRHRGIDLKGIVRALWRDITNLSASQGGSTITQQLVKKAVVGDDKTLTRKIKEAILAIQLERAYQKDYIFWMYLNQIPYGSNAYGIEAASQTFFGKPAMSLTAAEAAVLAVLPRAPTYYSPYGTHTVQLLTQGRRVLDRMRELEMLSEASYQTAIATPPEFKPEADTFPAPHFVIMVREYLIKKYGEDLVQNGGLKVITTLDADKQLIAEEVVKKYGDINEKRYKATNASLVAMDPRTGQILALVGSRDYFNTDRDGNFNVATSTIRQPGSSFKPFAYATAFLKGFSDNTVLFDLLTEFNPTCAPSGTQTHGSSGACYHPQNYNGTFSGPVTMRQALARSLNVPSVKTLHLAGIPDTVATAQAMGITTLDGNAYYGLSLVLGGAGVSLVDMVSGYSVFANDGVREPATFILKITSADGAILEEFKESDERAIPAQTARMISDILSDNDARAPVFGFANPLALPGRPVAAKTGTTQKNRDGWLIGYTPSLAAGVWTGNNDDTPMTAAGAGVSAAGPMWNEFMSRALKGTPVEYFHQPNPAVTDEPMQNGDFRGPDGSIHDILYYLNPRDPQFPNWEAVVRAWVAATGQSEATPTPSPSGSPLPFVTALPE